MNNKQNQTDDSIFYSEYSENTTSSYYDDMSVLDTDVYSSSYVPFSEEYGIQADDDDGWNGGY